jgi:hypothetical protein
MQFRTPEKEIIIIIIEKVTAIECTSVRIQSKVTNFPLKKAVSCLDGRGIYTFVRARLSWCGKMFIEFPYWVLTYSNKWRNNLYSSLVLKIC